MGRPRQGAGLFFIMKRIITCLLILFVSVSACSHKERLSQKAEERLHDSVEKAFKEELEITGDLEIKDLELIYDCDSLIVFQFNADITDSLGTKISNPIRYVFLLDTFMSMAEGKPAYCEGVFRSNILNKKEIADFKKKMDEQGGRGYSYFVGITSPVSD